MKKKLTDESFDMLFIDSPLYQLTPTTFALEIEKLVKYPPAFYFKALLLVFILSWVWKIFKVIKKQ